ncbi:MAG: hypothetical protein KC443_22450 [Anaerolineales bacterium]|nr:hypothetical protein [Anaerolineales bacterium]
MFQPDPELINEARHLLRNHHHLYWIVGGSCTGKSTISQAIAAATGLPIYDMDEHIYGRYFPLYHPQRHPANTAWLAASNPLAWQLALSPAAFNAFNQATTAEYLHLLATDLAETPDTPLLIDGGITYPSLAAQVIPAQHICCLAVDTAVSAHIWETDPDRAEMRNWIHALPEPAQMWQKFLQFDQLITETMVADSQAHHITTFSRAETTTIPDLAGQIIAAFALQKQA